MAAARRALFGDQIGSFYSLDAMTGKRLWRNAWKNTNHAADQRTGDSGWRGLHSGGVWEGNAFDRSQYACTFRGSATALH
jgi:hypothetical protein